MTPDESAIKTSDSRQAHIRRFELCHKSPAGQPTSVHQMTESLYAPFLIDGGSIHLAGCTINAIPVVKTDDGRFHSLNGDILPVDVADSLKLTESIACDAAAAVADQPSQIDLIEQQLASLDKRFGLTYQWPPNIELIWCNFVEGRLAIEIADNSVSIPFSLWAMRLANSVDRCPEYHCPQTGVRSYHVAADDHGTITCAESILKCAESGKRLIRTNLATCEVNGRLIDRELLMVCPVSRRHLAKSSASRCDQCYQSVDPAVVRRGRCGACRALSKTLESSPLVGHLIQEHPKLAAAQGWKIAESADYHIVFFRLDNRSWTLLVDRPGKKPISCAARRGWFGSWYQLDRNDWPVK